MKPTSLFLGACALACVAGAVGGMTTNTVPIDRAGIGSLELAARPAIADFARYAAPVALAPDHYALETPTGRIEVAELANVGLYSQERFGYERTAVEDVTPIAVEPAATATVADAVADTIEVPQPAEPGSAYARTVEFPSEPTTGT